MAFNAFADAWPRAIETEIGAALCAMGAGKDVDFLLIYIYIYIYIYIDTGPLLI